MDTARIGSSSLGASGEPPEIKEYGGLFKPPQALLRAGASAIPPAVPSARRNAPLPSDTGDIRRDASALGEGQEGGSAIGNVHRHFEAEAHLAEFRFCPNHHGDLLKLPFVETPGSAREERPTRCGGLSELIFSKGRLPEQS